MTYEEALPLVQVLVADLSPDEQLRLLECFCGPQRVQELAAEMERRKRKGGGGRDDPRERPLTMAVAAGRIP